MVKSEFDNLIGLLASGNLNFFLDDLSYAMISVNRIKEIKE